MSNMETGLTLTALGVTTVFSVLAVIAFIVAQIGRLDRYLIARQEAKAAAAAADPATAGSAPEPVAPNVDDTTLVLITAAVATLTQGRFHIRRIHRIGGPGPNAWSQQGRAVLQGSHSIVPKR